MNETIELLQISRKIYTDVSTIGELSVMHKQFSWTLEDTCRKTKIDKLTAIPAGRYRCVLDEWNKYKIVVIGLLDVPFFTHIKLHPLNTVDQTDGCIGMGYDVIGFNRIGNSGAAFRDLMHKTEPYLEKDICWCTITGGYRAEEWEMSQS